MQVGPLDLPDEVLSALEERRLVIFAGAGVSIPPPSSLPSFQGLVEELIGRPLKKGEEGQLDRLLGQAAAAGAQVHQLAAKRLSRPGARFNSLHENLVALFGSAPAVRIVTTNFDHHFEGAIKVRPELAGVEVYTAPALPVGSSFTGLVHLHGALGHAPENLVLTDADFGRAYLTQGWAVRFVVELFREYTVLFVGYSYGDTVMSYLTRGLAPTFGNRRFALTETGQREKWQLLGIQPIDYDPADDHRALADGLSQWVSFERRGFLDWAQRLPELVRRKPRALLSADQGELEFCLKNPKRAKLFYQHAKDPGWLEWAAERGRLQPLFTLEGDQESLLDLAHWFAEDPLGPRGSVALRVALKQLRPIGWALAVQASRQVFGALSAKGIGGSADAQRAAAWATLLTEGTAPGTPPVHLARWLDHLSPQDHPQLMVQILACLLRCRPLVQEETFPGEERDLGLRLKTESLGGYLGHLWTKRSEHIGALAWLLAPVITEIFEARWRWQVALEASTPRSDPWGWDRPWVERPPGESSLRDDIHESGVGLLLDIGKEILDALLAANPEKSGAILEQWLAASAPQLVQLGLYGLAKTPQWKPARKLERLLAHHLPARRPFKVEVFRVLQSLYPQLGTRLRGRFLERAGRLYRPQLNKSQEETDCDRTAAYEWFNVLDWLERAAPGDLLLERALARIRESYPEFSSRGHPELDIVHAEGGWVRPVSRLASDEIARLSLPQWLEELEDSRGRPRLDLTDPVGGFLEETARAASAHLEWGLSFTRSLLESGRMDHPVWPAILRAWGDRAFRPGEWSEALGVLKHPLLLATHPGPVSQVVKGRVRQKNPKATAPMLRSGLGLAEKLLPLAEEIPFTLGVSSENEDWLMQAINHPGGALAEFLILATDEILGPSPERGCGIPRTCKRLLDAIVRGTGRASAMGRVVLASNVHFFLGLAPDWTRANLLPLFDWDRDALQAAQAWHGFLTWGRPGATVLEELTPSAVQLASHLTELGGKRKDYGGFVARAASSLPDDPLAKTWFQAFLTTATADDRMHFAWQLNVLLKTLQPEQKAEVWRDWLRRYLECRAKGPPLPEGKEFTALLDWSFNLPGQLAELVEGLEALPGKGATTNRLFWKLRAGESADSDPNLLARLLLAVLKRCEKIEPWNLPELHAVIKRFIEKGTRADLIRELVEHYLEKGGPDHEELRL